MRGHSKGARAQSGAPVQQRTLPSCVRHGKQTIWNFPRLQTTRLCTLIVNFTGVSVSPTATGASAKNPSMYACPELEPGPPPVRTGFFSCSSSHDHVRIESRNTDGPDPPSPPPPPISPPPFFDGAEDCIPLPTASFFGIPTERVTENSDPVEERALCAFLKAVKEESMPADRCFAQMASPKPPPPPPAVGIESAQNMINELENERIAGDYGVKSPAGLNEADHLAAEIQESLAETHALIASFGETAPLLRDLLTRSAEEMENSIVAARDASASAIEGRRLMSRQFEFDTKLTDVLVDHDIQKDQYADGIPGIDKLSCETLCSAVTEQNASKACKAIVFKRQYPFSRTDRTGRCYLLKSAGSCFGRDFGAQLLTRQIDSENVCEEIAPGLHDTACISLPASRDDLRVLSHKDATDMAAATPANAPTSAGKLPLPRTVLEAMSLVAFARQYGIYAFWLRSPDSDGEVVVPIITAGGTNLIYHATETRCILVSSATSTAYTAMYASLHPCGAHLADGLVAVAVSTGPPPPPGTVGHALRHFPPPPPSSKAIAMSIWKRANIVPETRVVCSGAAGEGKVHRDICETVLQDWGPFRFIVGVGMISPLCSPLCFHSCEGSHIGAEDVDSFNNCQKDECAQTSCREFLDRECPLAMATQIRDAFRDYCTIAPPSPPALNSPPPPPSPPYSPSPMPPPPFVDVVERTRDGEIASDPDCGMIHYDQCLEIVRQYGIKNGFLPNVRVTTSTCSGVETDTDCFVCNERVEPTTLLTKHKHIQTYRFTGRVLLWNSQWGCLQNSPGRGRLHRRQVHPQTLRHGGPPDLRLHAGLRCATPGYLCASPTGRVFPRLGARQHSNVFKGYF